MMIFDEASVPALRGKTFIVTGANSGLGLETTRILARKQARVVMACRNLEKAEKAADWIRSRVEGARLELRRLDLASLESIRRFSDGIKSDHAIVDVLINNAGMMAVQYGETVDGFERQFGTNYLGHFALSLDLLPILKKTAGSRIVTVSSIYHKRGKMNWNDLQLRDDYNPWKAYSQSKLANLLFAFELDRRLKSRKLGVISVAAHPGYSATNIMHTRAEEEGGLSGAVKSIVENVASRFLAQVPAMGALPQVCAATRPGLKGGEYYGPGRFFELRGYPGNVEASSEARHLGDASTLWSVSEKLSGRYLAGS